MRRPGRPGRWQPSGCATRAGCRGAPCPTQRQVRRMHDAGRTKPGSIRTGQADSKAASHARIRSAAIASGALGRPLHSHPPSKAPCAPHALPHAWAAHPARERARRSARVAPLRRPAPGWGPAGACCEAVAAPAITCGAAASPAPAAAAQAGGHAASATAWRALQAARASAAQLAAGAPTIALTSGASQSSAATGGPTAAAARHPAAAGSMRASPSASASAAAAAGSSAAATAAASSAPASGARAPWARCHGRARGEVAPLRVLLRERARSFADALQPPCGRQA